MPRVKKVVTSELALRRILAMLENLEEPEVVYLEAKIKSALAGMRSPSKGPERLSQ